MPTPLTKKQMQETVDAFAGYGSEVKAAVALGVSRETFRSRHRAARAKGVTSSLVHKDSPEAMAAQIRKLSAELKLAQQSSSDLDIIKAIVGQMAYEVEKMEPPAWMLESKAKGSSPGVPTLFLSDLHWAEVVHPSQINGVNKYNLSIARERLRTAVTSAIHLLKIISPKLDYPGIVMPLGGDMISGNIHDELTATNEINSMPAVLDLLGELKAAITLAADTFGRVMVPCVSGNHGRDTVKIWGKDRHHTSFDWLLYKFLAKLFEDDKRVTFFIPDGPDAYYRVYNTRYLQTHGDQFRGGDGMIGALGPIIRGDHKKRSRNGQIDMNYDVLIMGHWHQYMHLSRLIVNGSLKGYDEYAYSNNFGFESPQQALWITHPKHGITFRMPVYVDRKRVAPKTSWVSLAA